MSNHRLFVYEVRPRQGASAPSSQTSPPDTEGGAPIESGVGATPSSVHRTNPLLGLERFHVWHTRRATSSTPQNRVVRRSRDVHAGFHPAWG